MAERARLLIVCAGNCTEGSNPSHSVSPSTVSSWGSLALGAEPPTKARAEQGHRKGLDGQGLGGAPALSLVRGCGGSFPTSQWGFPKRCRALRIYRVKGFAYNGDGGLGGGMVDTVDSKSTAMSVEVQILSRALRDGKEALTDAVIAVLPLFLEVLFLFSPYRRWKACGKTRSRI